MVMDHLDDPPETGSPNLQPIVDRIRPCIEPIVDAADSNDREAVLDRAIRAHVRATVDALPGMSSTIDRRIRDGLVSVAGAEYDLKSGVVDFFHVPVKAD
jgi:carbonic anhydrase